MKKIVLALAVVFSVALVSCGNKQAATEDSANVEVAEVEVAEDTVKVGDSVDTVVAAAGEVVEGEVPVEAGK